MNAVAGRSGRILTSTPVFLVSIFIILYTVWDALGPTIGSTVRYAYYSLKPVIFDWKVDFVTIEGKDVILRGSMRKRHECLYLPPPRAVDTAGKHYDVVSGSTSPGGRWPANGQAFQYGPWRIVDGAGQRLTLYQQHDCPETPAVTTILGVLDSGKLLPMPIHDPF